MAKTAVTYKCQKWFLRCLGTYKCQSELVGDQKLNKITSESQTQKLAKKQSKVNWLGSKTEQNLYGCCGADGCNVDVMVVEVLMQWWLMQWC